MLTETSAALQSVLPGKYSLLPTPGLGMPGAAAMDRAELCAKAIPLRIHLQPATKATLQVQGQVPRCSFLAA